MITGLVVQRFGCLRDVRLRGLTRLHALVGPNDSGKSTILQALRIAMALREGEVPSDARMTDAAIVELHTEHGRKIVGRRGPKFHPPTNPALGAATTGVRLVRFDPDALRQPSELIPESQLGARWHPSGAGLPGYLQLLEAKDQVELSGRVRSLFPTVQSIRAIPQDEKRLQLRIQLTDGTLVSPEHVSEGLLYYLGFEVLRSLAPLPMVLVEEPENGLHPARIRQVVSVLREISRSTQVILATHSPLVINELEPDEVTVVTRPDLEKGTRVTPLRETPNFEKRASVYALGELWLAYCDGDAERPLLEGPAP